MGSKVIQRDGRIGYLNGDDFVAKSSFSILLKTHVVTTGGSSGFVMEVKRCFDNSIR